MPTPRVIVELSPSRVEVAVARDGAHIEWRAQRFSRVEWPSAPEREFSDVASTLSSLLAGMPGAFGPATVIYSASGSIATITSHPSSLSPGELEQAARAALAKDWGSSNQEASHDVCPLLTDRRFRAGEEEAPREAVASPPLRRHVLAAADGEDRLASLCDIVQTAGKGRLTVERLIPADAIALADAATIAVAGTVPGELSAVLWIGEHSSQLAVGSSGRLCLARTVGIGLEHLVDALRRPAHPSNTTTPCSSGADMAHDDARALLLEMDFSEPSAAITAGCSLTGADFLSRLRIVLHRLSEEVEKTLVLAAPGVEPSQVALRIAGPGAMIRGLGAAIANAARCSAQIETSRPEPADAAASNSSGAIAALARRPALKLALAPVAVRQRQHAHRVRRALLAGAALALASIGLETATAVLSLRADEAVAARRELEMRDSEAPLAARRRAVAASASLASAEERARNALGQSPDWSAMLFVLAENSSPWIRLTAIDARNNERRSVLMVRGFVRFDESVDPGAAIQEFVRKLEATPIVERVRLAAAPRTSIAGHEAQPFELTIDALRLPPRLDAMGPIAHAEASP